MRHPEMPRLSPQLGMSFEKPTITHRPAHSMTLRQLQQLIGQIKEEAARLAQRLELADRAGEFCNHPLSADALARIEARRLRWRLSALYTRLHHLEARLPTPEVLSARAYDRMLALGFSIEAAEAKRATTFRDATRERCAA